MNIEYTELKQTIDSVRQDIELIKSYQKSVIGAGMESLDYPAGKLIDRGLADRYPDLYQIGSGMEGLSDLLGKLKTGLKSALTMAREKIKGHLEKPAKEVATEVNKTYTSSLWFKGKDPTDAKINANDLAKLIGGFTDVKSMRVKVDETIKIFKDAFDANTKLTRDFIAKADNEIKAAPGKLKGKTDAEYTEYAKDQIAIFTPLLQELKDTSTLPVIKAGTGDLSGLSVADAESIGKMIEDLLALDRHAFNEADDVRMSAPGQDVFDDIPDSVDNKAMGTLHWNYWYWESCTRPNSSMSYKLTDYILNIIKLMEKVITSAVK